MPLILLSPPQDSLYQTIPLRCKYCPVCFISDRIQAWQLQFYPLWLSIIFTQRTIKSSKQCCQTCPPQTKIGPRYSPCGNKLHWLPVPYRIASHLPTFSNSSVQQWKTVQVPKTNLKSAGNSSFHFQAAKIWNSLPTAVRNSPLSRKL